MEILFVSYPTAILKKVVTFLLIGFFVWPVAGMASKSEKKNGKDEILFQPNEKLANNNVRIRVEGASFRDFNLFFAPTQIENHPNLGQRKQALAIRKIIESDLLAVGGIRFVQHEGAVLNSGDERLLKQKGAEGLIKLSLWFEDKKIGAVLHHKNLITAAKGFKKFAQHQSKERVLAHLISQAIYEAFVGPENIFLLQIAAIKRAKEGSQVVLMDFDGHNERNLTSGPWGKSAPYFSADGQNIFYTVLSPSGQGIVEQQVDKSHFQFRTKKPGINLDARPLPDGSGLLATLSYRGPANIFHISKEGKILRRITKGFGLNLSPSISPDGKEMAFVSDRSGNPQIYVLPLLSSTNESQAKRLTFQGKYNQTPHYSPDGRHIVFTGRDENQVFDIFLIERDTGRISRITQDQGRNQEPYFTPSGRFVIFSSMRDGNKKPDLFLSTINGNHQHRLTNVSADSKSFGYYSPIVRPKQNNSSP